MKLGSNNSELTDEALAWMVRLQSPALTADEQKAFFDWLQSSEEHQRAYIDAEHYWQQLAVVEGYASANDESRGNNPKWQWPKFAVAAAIVLFAALLPLQFSEYWDTQGYQTLAGERRHLVLNDGSKVIINTGSSLRVKAMAEGELRKVYLDQGEAVFNVTSDKSRPFVVETPAGAVRVLGTQFTVLANEDDMLVTVLEGKVALLNDVEEAALPVEGFEEGLTLTANQQLSINQASKGLKPLNVDAEMLASWREGRLIYQGVSFDRVVADLSRYVDGEIRLADEAMKSVNVVAVFDIADKGSIVKALESALNVVAISQTDELTLLYPSKK